MQFKDIIGQREFINSLVEMTLNGRIPHTQLYFGTEGNQKLAIALAYAQFINCDHKIIHPNGDLKADSCGICTSCLKFKKLEHSDLHFIFPNNNSKELDVDKDSSSEDYFVQWKEMLNENNADFSLNNWLKKIEIGNKQGYINKRDIDRIINILSYRNAEAKFRVLIIWLPETFYHDIATRLLKMLEEPSEGTIFILISENMSNLAATILSRTQIFKIPRLEKQDIVDFLQKRYEFPLENCEEIAEQANGNLVTANTLAQKSDEFVENYKNFVEWMRNSYKFSLKDIVSFSEEMQKSGREQVKNFLNFCLNEFQNCLLLNNGNDNLVKISQEERQFLKNFAPFININNIERISSEVEKAIYHIERNGNIQIIMFDLGLIISKAIKNDR